MTFQIDDDVPQPRPRLLYPLRELCVGQSFFVPGIKSSQIGGSTASVSKSTGFTFTCRAVTEDGIAGTRVWRIK